MRQQSWQRRQQRPPRRAGLAPRMAAALALLAGALQVPAAAADAAGGPAQHASARRLYADIGTTLRGNTAKTVSLGLLLPARLSGWVPRSAGPLGLHWDLGATHWRAPRLAGGHRSFTQLAGLLVWRHALGGQAAPWFTELGLGATVYDKVYSGGQRNFSTAFQFTQALALGYRFGRQDAYELSVRFQHISNAGIKRPNPGEDIARLRLAMRF